MKYLIFLLLAIPAAAHYPIRSGNTLPATCNQGELFIKRNATTSQQVYVCTSANTWTSQGVSSIPVSVEFLAAVCQDTTATLGFNSPTADTPTATCVTGTNTNYAVARFTAEGQTLQGNFTLPADWASGTGNNVTFVFRSVETTGNVVWGLQTACVANGESLDPSFNAVQTATAAAQGTTLRRNSATITGFTTTGCAAGETFYFKISLHADTTTTGNEDLISVVFTLKRTITPL